MLTTTKKRILIVGGLVATLGGSAVYGVSSTAAASPAPERHPELRRALRALENARGDLIHAARDFGGHRAKAQELTEEAIKEVHAAIESDRK